MEIKLYQCTSEKNDINKKLTSEKTLTGGLVENTNIINPAITVAMDNSYFLYNYCYIPSFNRFYYINDIEVTNKCCILHLHVDVLTSHKNDILNSTAHVVRSKKGSRYIKDPLVTTLNKVNWQCRKVGGAIPMTNTYVLQVGGGN